MGLINTAVKRFMLLLAAIAIALSVAMFVTVGLNVFMRYVVNQSLGWADELSRFLFIWVSLLGAAMAFEKGQHVGLDFVIDRIRNRKVKLFFILLSDVLALMVLVILFRQGLRMVDAATNTSPALSIHMKYWFASLPVGVGIMVILGVLKLVDHAAVATVGSPLGVVEEEESEDQKALREGIEKHLEETRSKESGDRKRHHHPDPGEE